MSDDSGTSVPAPAGALRAWLAGRVAETSGVEPEEIDTGTPFDVYGVNSTDAVSLSGELADRFGIQLAPTALYDHPTIDALVAHLVPAAPAPAAAAAPAPAAAPETATTARAHRHGPTLDDLVAGAWEGLLAGAPAECLVCGTALTPRHSAGAGIVGGRCGGCGTTVG